MPTTQASSSKTTVKLKKPTMGKSKANISSSGKFVTPEQRLQMIAEAAYYMAESRGFKQGDPEADWLCAESQVDKMLTNQ